MRLRVLLPFGIFADEGNVLRIVVETSEGWFGLLPLRLDCVAVLVPGILSFETKLDGEVFFALDEGVLVKTAGDVVISVRRALRDKDLAMLRDKVEREFLAPNTQEDEFRAAMAGLEAVFLRRFASVMDSPA